MGADPPNFDDSVFWHGLDPEHGGPLAPPCSWDEFRHRVVESFRPTHKDLSPTKKKKVRSGPPQGVDVKDLSSAGWGVIFAKDTDPKIRNALTPLLEHRRAQSGNLFKIFEGNEGLIPGQTADDWLITRGIGPGVGHVEHIPYYLMVVADPSRLPFGVEFDLGAGYAVGRLAFDKISDYERYALNVVQTEQIPVRRRPSLTIFNQRHADDRATDCSSRHLIHPIIEQLKKEGRPLETVLVEEATKERLSELLGGPETPSILFSAGHGLGPGKNGKYAEAAGSLVCHDYPGPKVWGKKRVPPEYYFAASDIDEDADLRGLVALFFGCYTAGLPEHDSFTFEGEPRRIAQRPIISSLAKGLLAHKNGALAVLGHVDIAWGHSYVWRGHSQPFTFLSVLKALLDQEPIGAAARYLGSRYLQIALIHSQQRERLARGGEVDKDTFVRHWIAEKDARSYLVVGDPAVRARPITSTSDLGPNRHCPPND